MLGVKNSFTFTKFASKHQLAILLQYASGQDKDTVLALSCVQRRANTTLRIINACFHDQNIDDFLRVNDAKNRHDHEIGVTYKTFWKNIETFVNSMEAPDNEDVSEDEDKEDRDSTRTWTMLVMPQKMTSMEKSWKLSRRTRTAI